MTPDQIEADENGKNAYHDGKELKDNPYDKVSQSDLHQAWLTGYNRTSRDDPFSYLNVDEEGSIDDEDD